MPNYNNRNDTKGWKPTRLDTAASTKGRDISSDIDRASKSRSAASLKGSKRDRC